MNWKSWAYWITKYISNQQRPEAEKFLCPRCGSEVGKRWAGLGSECWCECGWCYYTHTTHRLTQEHYGPSADGYREGGTVDSWSKIEVTDGVPPIAVNPNAAWRIKYETNLEREFDELDRALYHRLGIDAPRPEIKPKPFDDPEHLLKIALDELARLKALLEK